MPESMGQMLSWCWALIGLRAELASLLLSWGAAGTCLLVLGDTQLQSPPPGQQLRCLSLSPSMVRGLWCVRLVHSKGACDVLGSGPDSVQQRGGLPAPHRCSGKAGYALMRDLVSS